MFLSNTVVFVLFLFVGVDSDDKSRFLISVVNTDYLDGQPCGGVMINSRWAMSCADCVRDLYQISGAVKLTAGFSNGKNPEIVTDVIETRSPKSNDIVLLKLKDTIVKSENVDFPQFPPTNMRNFRPCKSPVALGLKLSKIPEEAVQKIAEIVPSPPTNGTKPDQTNKTAPSTSRPVTPAEEPNDGIVDFLRGLVVHHTKDSRFPPAGVFPNTGADPPLFNIINKKSTYPHRSSARSGPPILRFPGYRKTTDSCTYCSGNPLMCRGVLTGIEVNCAKPGDKMPYKHLTKEQYKLKIPRGFTRWLDYANVYHYMLYITKSTNESLVGPREENVDVPVKNKVMRMRKNKGNFVEGNKWKSILIAGLTVFLGSMV